MLKDASLATDRAEAQKNHAEKRAEAAENELTLLMAGQNTLQKRYESAVSTASTAYRLLAALQEQINLERCAAVRCCFPCFEGSTLLVRFHCSHSPSVAGPGKRVILLL